MPAKKAAPQKAQSTDMGMIWKWVYALFLLVAAVAGAIGFSNLILTWILVLVAIVLAIFYFDADEIEHFGLRVLILIGAYTFAGQMGMDQMQPVGSYIFGFFGGMIGFLVPIVLTMALVWLWKHRYSTLFS